MWTETCEQSFLTLKERFTIVPMLSIPNGHEDFFVYSVVSGIRLHCVLL